MRKNIIIGLIGLILGISISVGAVYLATANDIKYTNEDNNITNVQEALDDLTNGNKNFKIITDIVNGEEIQFGEFLAMNIPEVNQMII